MQELVAFHRPRVAKLLKEGVDILACETIPAKVHVYIHMYILL